MTTKEAHIICQTRTYEIPDMGLKMIKGQLVCRTETEAKASKDLKHAINTGAVTVRYIQRAQQTRPRPTDISVARFPARKGSGK